MITLRSIARPIPRPMPLRRKWRRAGECLAIGGGLLLAALSPALAQGTPAQEQTAADDGSAVPAREGNIWGHEEHQPTGTASPANDDEVEMSVDELLRQSDQLDKAAEEQAKDYPGTSSPAPASSGPERQ